MQAGIRGGIECRGAWGTFWSFGNVLYHERGPGYMYINFSFLTGGLMKIYASHFYVTLISKRMYPKPMLNSSSW